MSNWKSIDLMDVTAGMATNPINPGTKYAQRLLNVYAHEKPGALTLRPGYAPKYTPPTNSTITSSTFLSFAPFFDRQADPEGREIICEIQRGVVTALKDELDQPIVANTIQGFWFWVRPYWDGSQWINSWQWVNRTIITKITSIDATYPSHIKIFGNLTHGLTDDSLIGWTIYNFTRNQFAKVITCKAEGTGLWLNITLYDNQWVVNDVIFCSRHWIDVDVQIEFFNNVEKEDIVFHRINHDLRIGFGGKANRPGLMIGYRKDYYQIREIDFPNIHPDLAQADAIEKFSKTDGIVLETPAIHHYSPYGLDLYTDNEGELEGGSYYFRLTGILDNYEEQLLAENNIIVESQQKIKIYPHIILGRESIRTNKLKLYAHTDDRNHYLSRELLVKDSVFNAVRNWKLDRTGKLILTETEELHTEGNAVSIVNEQNSFGSWTEYNTPDSFEIDTVAANAGDYSFKITVNNISGGVEDGLRKGIRFPLPGLRKETTYRINCHLKANTTDVFEDFEDTNYNLEFANGFTRIGTGNPIGSFHLFSASKTSPYPTVFPFGAYIKIVANKPKNLEFSFRGSKVSVRKRFGSGSYEALETDIVRTGSSYTDANKVTVEINDNRNGVEIYIIHEPDHFDIDEGMMVGVWDNIYIDNVLLRTNAEARSFFAFLVGNSLSSAGVRQTEILNIGSAFELKTFDVLADIKSEQPTHLVIACKPNTDEPIILWIDEVSIKEKDAIVFDNEDKLALGTEISSEMGYTPTYNLVEGWDQALLRRGRVYYLNPFVEKRYDNFLLVSHIAPPNTFMWDMASFSNFRELEKYDSNETVAIELLPNNDILILKDSSVTALSDDGLVGIMREPVYGIDCVSRSSVVNINGLVFWCGKEEIYLLNIGRSLIPEPLLKNTIRDLYLAIEDKTKIFGTRNRFNTYRIRINDVQQKLEYLFTENGWVEERKWHFPEIYRPGFNNKLYFMNNGTIYEEQVDFSLPVIYYGQNIGVSE